MGSLPNLHELDEIERKREKRREREQREQLREQRVRDSSRERERLTMFAHRKQSSYNAYLMAGLGMGGCGTLGMVAAAGAAHLTSATTAATGATGGGVSSGGGGGAAAAAAAATTTLSGFAVGGAALLGFSTTGLLSKHQQQQQHHHHQQQQQQSHQHQHHQQHHQQHRHSLTSRHRVLRTRSSGATHNILDEQMMEHLAAYSPISTRSHRINPVSSYQVQAALAASRRRESINSSIGATSIRRLITLNTRNCRHKVAPHVRQAVCKNFTFLTVAHGLMCAVLLPLVGLQGSNSVWHHREQWLHVGPNIGSLLLSASFLLAAGMCLLTTRLLRKFGYTLLIGASYAAFSLFLLCHVYPSIYTLLPAYVLLGVTLSPAWVSKIALVVHFGSKLSCSQHECMLSGGGGVGIGGNSVGAHAMMDPLDEHKIFCNRDQKVRRLARWFQASQDLGLIVGALVASLVLACTATDWNCFDIVGTAVNRPTMATVATIVGNISSGATDLNYTTSASPPTAAALHHIQSPKFWPHINGFFGYFDDFYNRNEHGERICGADMCPVWRQAVLDEPTVPTVAFTTTTSADISNETIFTNFINGKARAGGLLLIGIYFSFSLTSLLLSVLAGKVQASFRPERVKGITDTLLFAGPMAYFIGTEQAYMLGDFLRAFVSCSLGISMVAGALVGMGLMQLIVSCTLSMLLRHTKRIVVILAGFFFHSCLLLALSSWKPSSDDSALFYVLAASWGACNAMWETLLLALITLNHANHVTEVTAPLQGLRFLGLGVTFAAHGFMCETPKIIILVIILVVSVPPYAMLEIRMEAQRKAHMISL